MKLIKFLIFFIIITALFLILLSNQAIAPVFLWQENKIDKINQVEEIVETEKTLEEVHSVGDENTAQTDNQPHTDTKKSIEKIDEQQEKEYVLLEVPFVVQATANQWTDDRFQDACEETAALMAVSWARGSKLSQADNTANVLAMSAYQQQEFGAFQDTSAADTIIRIFNGYFDFYNVWLKNNISIQDIINELQQGNIIIVPINGQVVGNPFFTQPGPERHMVLICGWDPETDEFITNDAGIGRGEKYRYPTNVLFNAIRDYQTGYHEEFLEPIQKNMLVISKD